MVAMDKETAASIGTDANPNYHPLLLSLEKYRVTELTKIDPPEPIVKINGETISTKGNITTFSGASKSGKSAFSSCIISGAISRDGIIDGFDSVEVTPNREGYAVIHIDTEQAKHKQQRNLKTILKRSGLDSCPHYFLSYNFRDINASEYSKVTRDICIAAKMQFKGIHLIVIDGIADYITDVNDPIQSSAIIKMVMELSSSFNVAIILIVHTNPGSDKERGHLGSECQRKSESVLTIKTEGDLSYVEPKLLREAGKSNIPLIQFMYDKNKGYHIGCGVRQGDAINKDELRVAATKELVPKVFGQKALMYKEAIEAIQKETMKGTVKAKEIFSDMKAHQFINQGNDKNWRMAV